jgi:hypothetical protein
MEIICPVFAGNDTRTNQEKKEVVEKKKSDKTKDLWVIGKMKITAIKFMKPEVRKVMTIMLLRECLFLLFTTMSFYRQNVIKSLKDSLLAVEPFCLLKKFKNYILSKMVWKNVFNLFLRLCL